MSSKLVIEIRLTKHSEKVIKKIANVDFAFVADFYLKNGYTIEVLKVSH